MNEGVFLSLLGNTVLTRNPSLTRDNGQMISKKEETIPGSSLTRSPIRNRGLKEQ
jgi:hypothetical protein